jgi:chromosome segregation protein
LRLSTLNIYGFKSFADKLDIEFGDGMTSVVGPNGCGKTNVVDAIKWVMGEQRPASIRGKSMEDVIFAGSAGRKPLGFAEVSLTITDTQNVLPIDAPEVTITRRLFRNGDSEYLINKQQCRLRDIHDLFMDSGIANNAYSVIQQEMVDVIISDKTDERRMIFEEAAGIQKYKSRRRETQSKLKSTMQDLLRIGDVIAEVDKSVRSLKRQVNRAKRYQQYRERLSVAEVHLAKIRDRRFDEEMRPIREQLRELRESREGTGSAVSQRDAAVAEVRRQATDMEKAVADLQREVDEARDRVREVESELIAMRERGAAAAEAAERGRNDAEDMEKRRVAAIDAREELLEDREKAQDELTDLQKKEKETDEGLGGIERRLEEAETALEELTSRHSRASHYYQDEAQRAEFLQFKVDERRRRLESLKRQQAEATSEAERALREQEQMTRQLEEIRTRRTDLRQGREEAEKAREEAAERLEKLSQEKAGLEGSLKASVAEREVVRGLVERLEGVEDAARNLRDSDEPGFGKLLAEILRVDEEAVTAVEAALGPALEGLLLADDAALSRAVERLQELEDGGRAALLAPHLVGGEAPDLPSWAAGEAACRGCLADVVAGEGIESMVARGLLARDASADGWTLVTSGGEIVAPGGYVHAGRPAASGAGEGLLARRRRLEDLEGQSVELQLSLGEAEATLGEQRDRSADLRARFEGIAKELEETDGNLHALERAQGTAQSRHESLTERASDLEERVTMEEEELEQDQTELEKLSPLLTQALQESGELGGALEQKRVDVSTILAERDKGRHALQEIRLGRVREEHRIEGIDRETRRLEESAEELAEAAARRREEAAQSDANAVTLRETITEREGVLEQRQEVRKKLEADLSQKEDAYLEKRNEQAEMDEELRKERKAREDQQEQIHALDLKLSEFGMRRENLVERMREEYDIDLEDVDEEDFLDEGQEPPDLNELDEEVRTLRERLDKLGPVNLLALEEYEAEKDRLDFLTEQRDDLDAARNDLQQTIRKINQTARQRFLETFGAIQTNFRETYSQFFEGGEADIYLADEDDPLEARIEIVARPKGKILKSMAALSGGERALTAVALLFAIYLVKPSPFCILDEVDAPLDEANIVRFLKVLEAFEDRVQFILITHNKRTMEATDTFLGITMEEPGVSSVVGVRFGEEAAA